MASDYIQHLICSSSVLPFRKVASLHAIPQQSTFCFRTIDHQYYSNYMQIVKLEIRIRSEKPRAVKQ